jgi:uncharacterized coiled-coil protein SlyX
VKFPKAISDIPSMAMEEADLLESKLNLQFTTIDNKVNPNIQPLWFSYEKQKEKMSLLTGKKTTKSQNVQE